MEEKRDLFREIKEFVDMLPEVDELGRPKTDESDEISEMLDAWIATRCPKGSKPDPKLRELAIAIIKKGARMVEVFRTSPFKPYIDAILEMNWKEIQEEEKKIEAQQAKQKKGKKTDHRRALVDKFAFQVFVLGYCFRSLNPSDNKEEKKKDKPAS